MTKIFLFSLLAVLFFFNCCESVSKNNESGNSVAAANKNGKPLTLGQDADRPVINAVTRDGFRESSVSSPPKSIFIRPLASSTLPDNPEAKPPYNQRRIRYACHNMFDNDPFTVWSEGSDGPGIGQSVAVYFGIDGEVQIDEIEIMPGYFDDRYFKANNRVRRLSIALGNEKELPVAFIAQLKDEMAVQSISLREPLALSSRTDTLKIIIDAVYPGSKWDDTCISGIRFYYKGEQVRLRYDDQILFRNGSYILPAGDEEICIIVAQPFTFRLHRDFSLEGENYVGPGMDYIKDGTWKFDSATGTFYFSYTFFDESGGGMFEGFTDKYQAVLKPCVVLGTGSREIAISEGSYRDDSITGYMDGLW